MEEKLDRWLDTAMAEYGDVHPPLGFEARTITRLRDRRVRRGFIRPLSFAMAMAPVVVAMVIGINAYRAVPADPPMVAARISVPQIQRVTPVTSMSSTRRAVGRPDSTRGVPLVASSLTPQEETILRMVRNARASQLASLTVPHADLTKESNQLQIKELNIPPVVKEEEQ